MEDKHLEQIRKLLEGSYLFKKLDDTGRREMEQLGETVSFAAGEQIIAEGSEGNSFFLLVDGQVQVSAVKDGKPVVLTKLGRGAVLGEVALITGQPRTATVTAMKDCKLVSFADPGISDFLGRYPKVKELLVRVLVHRAKDTVEKLTVS